MIICGFTGKYEPFSNFYRSPIVWQECICQTVEHGFHAFKTHDPDLRKKILEAPNAGKAKYLGRLVPLRPDWEEVKESIMLGLLRVKFSERFYHLLLVRTGKAYLEETNTWKDRYWGVDGYGLNRLGHLLMQVRSELQTEAEKARIERGEECSTSTT